MLGLLLLYLLAGSFCALYVYFTRNFNFWTKNGVPYERPVAFLGNLKEVALARKHLAEFLEDVYRRHKRKGYVGIYAFSRPLLVVTDLELVRNVLVKDFHVFVDHNFKADPEKDPFLNRSVFSLKGQKWKNLRNHISPTFTSGKMKRMFNLVDNVGKDLAQFLDKFAQQGEPVDVKETLARYTTDVIATCAFGIDAQSVKNPDSEFRRELIKFNQVKFPNVLGAFFAFFAPELMDLFRIQITDSGVTEFVRKLIWSNVKYREEHGIVRKDFLASMMELRRRIKEGAGDEDSGFDCDGDDFVAQSFVFITAGFETSATTMTFALYELALNPGIQSRLRTEICEALQKHNQEVTYDAMQEMTYLDMVVCETLRKYSIAPFLDRLTVSDYELPGDKLDNPGEPVVLPKDTAVLIPVCAIHHDPEYYPNPEKFDPERFTEENRQSRPNYTYLPFGDGPRICIGMRFALMQVKTGLIHILSHYEVAPCKDTPIPLTFAMTFILVPKAEVPLAFKRIQRD